MPNIDWRTEKRKISDLLPTANNPRILTEKQFGDLKKSIEKFNLVEIPAINTTGQILAGHQRLKIMQAVGRGYEEIDVRVPNRELTKKECEEYIIRSNKNTGEWDFNELANSFNLNDLIEWGFKDTELLGFFSDKKDDSSDDIEIKEKFAIEIEFSNEQELQSAYNKLQSEGYECRVLTL